MADAPCNATFKAICSFSTTSLGSCKGGSVNMTPTFVKTNPGTRVSQTMGLDVLDCDAEVIHEELVTPIALGTAAASLVFTLTQLDGGSNTVTLATMRPAGASINMTSKPYSQTSRFVFDAGNTENIAPVTVS